jgi:hypothetical protein
MNAHPSQSPGDIIAFSSRFEGDARYAPAQEFVAEVCKSAVSVNAALDEIMRWNSVACTPPFDRSEFEEAVKAAFAWKAKNAAAAARPIVDPARVSVTNAAGELAPADPVETEASPAASQAAELIPDTEGAIAFLEELDRDGRYDLAAIDPDLPGDHHDKIRCATFVPGQRDKMRAWIDKYQGQRNQYYTLNRARDGAPYNKRLAHNEKTKQIEKIRGIPVDLDLKGKTTAQDLRILMKELRDSACPPTVVVDTGGGFQPLWLLEPLNTTVELSAGIGRAFQDRYGGDSVWDPPRILRLPGTINILSPEKRKEGRVPALASVVPEYSSGKRYAIEELAAWAPPVAARTTVARKTFSKIDMSMVEGASVYEDLPIELRDKFEKYCVKRPAVAVLWRGDQTPVPGDGTPSAYVYSLASHLRRPATFTVTEFAQLVWVWDYRSQTHENDFERYVSRAWDRSHVAFGTGAESWGEPTDLWAEDAEPVDLPPGVVPAIIEAAARDHALRLGIEAGASAAALITAMGSLVHAGNSLQMRQVDTGWTVRPILWTAIVAESGTNKSATLSYAMEAVRSVNDKLANEYAIALQKFNAQQPLPGRRRTISIVESSPAERNELEFAPEEPRLRQKIINNATTEAIADILANNPEGVLNFRDELSGFFGGMDLYHEKGGIDRSYWLEAKDGGGFTVNRRRSKPIVVKNNAVTVLGAIQPDVMRNIGDGLVDDGLLQRFAPVFLRRIGVGADVAANQDVADELKRIAAVLIDADDAATYRFSPEANTERIAYEAFVREQMDLSGAPPAFRQWLEKTINEFGRLALVFHFLEWHSSEEGRLFGGPPPSLISLETARRARRYLSEFIYPHAQVFYRRILGSSPSEEHARWIAGYILSGELSSVSARDISRHYSQLKDPKKRQELVHAMSLLETNDWVRSANWTNRGPTTWAVNPVVHLRYSARAELERNHRLATRQKIAQNATRRRESQDQPEGGLP